MEGNIGLIAGILAALVIVVGFERKTEGTDMEQASSDVTGV